MIQEGLIWTYYNCSHACYLFGEYELPCIFMTLSYSLFALALIGIILFIIYKFASKQEGVKNDN